jgi:hypothetical protein
MWKFALLALPLLLSGCATSLSLQRAGEGGAEASKRYAGIPYPMMFTTFQVDITHRLIDCSPAKYDVASTVEISSPITAPDMNNMFLIDPNSLTGPFKSGDVKVTYLTNGAISSLNASADDKSVAVIANVVGGVIKIASIGLMAAADAAKFAPAPSKCNDDTMAALAAMARAEPDLERDTVKLKTATDNLKKIADKLAAMGSNADEKTRTRHSDALDALNAIQSKVKAEKVAIEKLLRLLAITKTIRWPEDSSGRHKEVSMSLAEESKWGIATVAADLVIGVALEPAFQMPDGWTPQSPGYKIDPKFGLPYRLALPGRLKVCNGACKTTTEVYAETVANILQLGDVYYIPCRSPAFTSSSCELTYADTGELKSMGTMTKSASAENISAAFKDAATQYGDYRSARSASEEKAKGTELATLKAEAELAAAKAALVKDPSAGVLAQTASIKATTGLAEAKLALLEAEAALAASPAK